MATKFYGGALKEGPLRTHASTPKGTTMSDELIREILGASKPDDISDAAKAASKLVKGTEEVTPPAPSLPESKTWEENGYTVHLKPFSEVFGWEPEIPHMVKTYEGSWHVDPVMEGYILDKPTIESVSLCDSLGLKQNLTGPTGCGKTQLAEWYAAMLGRPYLRIGHTESFDRTEVFGQVHITDGDTDFRMGVLPRTFDAPYVVLLDELTRAPAGALMTYGTLFDRRHLLLPEMKDGGMEPLEPVDGWTAIAADNTKGNGDGMDRYIASNVQDSAFLNRFDVLHDMDYLSEKQEVEFMITLGLNLPSAELDRFALMSKQLHTGVKDGKLSTDFSPRNLQAITKLVNAGLPLARAFKTNYLNRVCEAEVEDVRETWRSVFGKAL